jgi:hypothetical protein
MIRDFIAQVKTGGLARNNRYAVIFVPPAAVSSSDRGDYKTPDYNSLNKVLLFCDQVQLPGLNYSTIQNRTFGEFREVPYERLFDAATFSFYVDTEFKVKKLFDEWSNGIQNPVTRNFNYYNSYTTPLVIEVQDLNDKTRYQMTLHECYPKTIGSIQLDYASKDVMKIQVTMQYKYWTATPITQLSDGQKIPTSLIDKLSKNFTGFQETLNRTLGERAGNFVTGSALTYAVTKLPSLLRF